MAEYEKKIYVLGIATPELTDTQQALLNRCHHLFTTKRFASLAPAGVEIHPVTPLAKQIEKIGQLLARENDIAVFASGDPLFYGIVRTLLRHFPPQQLHIEPALSSIQRAAALFRLRWDDAHLISLHGRDTKHLPGLFLRHQKTFTLTNTTYSPTRIADEILNYFNRIEEKEEAKHWQVFVAEDIGTEKEKIFQGSLAQCAAASFSALNVFAMSRQQPPRQENFTFGLTEQNIQHSRGLITKNEVRAATLHTLQLPKRGVFWDVGAGSGSISIEAARLHPELIIYSVEQKDEELINIKANIRRFHCYNIIPIAGLAPDALENLPKPDCIFVGGSSGQLAGIIACAAKNLSPCGQLVINGVITKTITTAKKLLTENGFFWESATVKVSRRNSSGSQENFNPITIFSAQKG